MKKNDVIDAIIRQSIEQYFLDLGDEEPCAVYEMLLCRIEKPLFEVVLKKTEGNQTRAAEILGMNRNTLRKKMKLHGL